jgi:alpha-L-fucosidase
MQWFREARFGMFIHFGGSTNNDKFNPGDCDAKEWVRIAKAGGMKYIVYTSKHHNGFCNWDSALTDNDVMDKTEFKRDIIAELSDACKAEGIRLGLYYSIADHHHPQYPAEYSNRNGFHYSPNPDADITKYMVYMYGQIRELCEKYQPSLFWFDGSAGFRAPAQGVNE